MPSLLANIVLPTVLARPPTVVSLFGAITDVSNSERHFLPLLFSLYLLSFLTLNFMLQLSPDLLPPSFLGGPHAHRAIAGASSHHGGSSAPLHVSASVGSPSSVPDESPTLALVPYVSEGTWPTVEVSAIRDPVEGAVTRDPVEGSVTKDPVGASKVPSPPPMVPAPATFVVTLILAPVMTGVLC